MTELLLVYSEQTGQSAIEMSQAVTARPIGGLAYVPVSTALASIDGFDEHIPLSSNGVSSSDGIRNMTAHAVLSSEQSKNLPFVTLCKALKNFRFCINANRIYTDAKSYNGYNRDLIYYDDRVKRV